MPENGRADVVLVGAGKMGGALLDGWLASGVVAPGHVTVIDPQPSDEIKRLAAKGTIVHHPQPPEVLSPPAALVIAVKPQIIDTVLPSVKGCFGPETVCLSVAAGIPLERLERHLGRGAALGRAMPNMPAAVGRGATAVVFADHVTEPQRGLCRRLLEAVGAVFLLDDEALMDAVTAVSGSGPAYVFLLIECLGEAGRAVGLPAQLARDLALATVAGAAELAVQSDEDPARLREAVTSPGGTTAAALDVLMGDEGLASLMRRAVRAAAERSRELGAG